MDTKKQEQKKRLKKVIIWGVVILGIVGLIWGLSKWGDANPSPTGGTVSVETTVDDHIKGNPDADVTIIEYSDFQCPACKSFEPLVSELVDTYGDDIKFVYRHFPLRTIHQNAEEAAWAAEAAGKQGKFWEMHDKLFAEQTRWSRANNPAGAFEDYAEELGLNVEQFKQDYESDDVQAKVNKDLQEARRAGASGTPTFVINGDRLGSPPTTIEGFGELINEYSEGEEILPAEDQAVLEEMEVKSATE